MAKNSGIIFVSNHLSFLITPAEYICPPFVLLSSGRGLYRSSYIYFLSLPHLPVSPSSFSCVFLPRTPFFQNLCPMQISFSLRVSVFKWHPPVYPPPSGAVQTHERPVYPSTDFSHSFNPRFLLFQPSYQYRKIFLCIITGYDQTHTHESFTLMGYMVTLPSRNVRGAAFLSHRLFLSLWLIPYIVFHLPLFSSDFSRSLSLRSPRGKLKWWVLPPSLVLSGKGCPGMSRDIGDK